MAKRQAVGLALCCGVRLALTQCRTDPEYVCRSSSGTLHRQSTVYNRAVLIKVFIEECSESTT